MVRVRGHVSALHCSTVSHSIDYVYDLVDKKQNGWIAILGDDRLTYASVLFLREAAPYPNNQIVPF